MYLCIPLSEHKMGIQKSCLVFFTHAHPYILTHTHSHIHSLAILTDPERTKWERNIMCAWEREGEMAVVEISSMCPNKKLLWVCVCVCLCKRCISIRKCKGPTRTHTRTLSYKHAHTKTHTLKHLTHEHMLSVCVCGWVSILPVCVCVCVIVCAYVWRNWEENCCCVCVMNIDVVFNIVVAVATPLFTPPPSIQ